MMKARNFIKANPLYLLLVSILLCFFTMEIWCNIDYDFYHMVLSGEWIVENKAIQYENTIFVEEGYKTIVQQWLYCIPLYLSYSALGIVGVQLFVTIQFLALAFMIYKLLVLFKIDKRTAVFVIAASMLVMGYVNCRPQMISLILFYAQLYVLEKHRQTGKTSILYLLPLFTLLEINLHCTFWVFHFVFILPYIVPCNKLFKAVFKRDVAAIEDTTVKIKPLIIPMLLMAASLFINPYGIDAITCLFFTSSLSLLSIVELQPIVFISEFSIYILGGFIIIAVLYNKKKLTSTTLYTALGTSLLTALVTRNVLFYSIAVVFLFKDLFKDVDMQRFYNYLHSGKMMEKLSTAFSHKACAAVYAVGLLVALPCGSAAFAVKGATETDTCNTPLAAAEWLQENEPNLSSVRMFTETNAGSYFVFKGVGKVYLEPKSEPYVERVNGKKDIIKEFVFANQVGGSEAIHALIDEYDFDYLYVPFYLPVLQTALEANRNYECVFITETVTTLVDKDIPIYRIYKRIASDNA